MHVLEVGKPYDLFAGRDMASQDGCILEFYQEYGGYGLILYMNKMTEIEKLFLRRGKIRTRVINENNFVLTLLNINNDLYFDVEFDPLLYKDSRMNNILNTNMMDVIGVESSDNTVQTLRYVSVPMKLYNIWIKAWTNAKYEQNFSERYKRWVKDLQIRYDLEKLWDMGIYVGYMGE